MTVIRTSLKRKLIKATAAVLMLSVIAAAAVFISPIYAETVGITVRDDEIPSDITEIDNMNGSGLVLFEPEETPVTDQLQISVPEVYEQAADSEETEERMPVFSEKYLRTYNRSTENEDLSEFDIHSGIIYEKTFGKGNGPEYIELDNNAQLRNCTDIDNDTVRTGFGAASDIAVELYSDKPQVLILHTHTTESYEPYTKSWFDEQYTSRSLDPDNGVVAVGDAIAEQLAAAGISVIHDCTIHDAVYTGAYSRSLSTAVSDISEYSSIKVVLDIHRDAIEYSDGSRISAVTEIDGKKAAQVMVICAADDGTYDVPHFYDNLHFACELQQSIEGMYPTLTRPILFQYCQYNQQVSAGALLIEVGSHGNSIDEAVYSGELIGRSLAALLTSNAETKPEAIPVMAGMPKYFLDRVR
ncbi:MAG: stage II sporulation protein P [Ruminiclostridium sp.]|nr:stage II sporulation protein P [Ruminiclostridium sp.]